MSARIDLHSHSTASDGTLSPSALVRRAQAAGIQVLALTDHDTTEGIAEAVAMAGRLGMRLVPGVEISVTWEGQVVHLVGLDIDPACEELQRGLAGLRRFRSWRAEEIGRRLAARGIAGAYEGAKSLSNGRLISRTHFARFLVQQGHADTERKVFRHYLVRGKPGHVPGEWAELGEAVGWIRQAGGQAVVAHPARYRLSRTKLLRLLRLFVAAGGQGLEVVSGCHSKEDALTMARLAREFGLLASLGSDYHGPENPWFELGRLPSLPEGVAPVWRDWPIAADRRPAVCA